MGFRFRKTIKLFPGVRINLGKSGVSTSIGRRGATLNISKRGTRGTVRVPGTGVSFTEKLSDASRQEIDHQTPTTTVKSGSWVTWSFVVVVLVFVALTVFGR